MTEQLATYYTLAESAEKLNKSQNDLLRMAGNGELSLLFWYNGRVVNYFTPKGC